MSLLNAQSDSINTGIEDQSRRLVFISLEPWDDIWRRNQFVCRELAARGWEILFVEPPADWAAAARGRDRKRMSIPKPWSPEGIPNVTVVRPVKILPRSYRLGRSVNHWLLRRMIHRQCIGMGWQAAVLWVNDQSTWRLAEDRRWSRVVYDVTDDWSEMGKAVGWREQIKRDDASLCAVADHVIVCSDRLLELKRMLTPNVSLVPNGVDVDHYRSVRDENGLIPETCKTWKGPVLGYTGTIHPDRIDVGLLYEIAKEWSGTVALIGPEHLGSDRYRLDELENVVIIGPVPYCEIPDWMRQIDVMIVPHLLSKFTESLNPIKLWEYLASGMPIVSTPVAGFRDFPRHVRLARDAKAFVSACHGAVDESEESAVLRRDVALAHDWHARVDEIERALFAQDEFATDHLAEDQATG